MTAPTALQLLAGGDDKARRLLDLAHDFTLAADPADRTVLQQQARKTLAPARFLRFEQLCEAVIDWMRWQWKCDGQTGSAVEADDRVLGALFVAVHAKWPCPRCTVTAQHIGQIEPAAELHVLCVEHRDDARQQVVA